MNFNSIRIVLVATSHPGNIGSTARAMKTMGFRRLYLVRPKAFPDPRAHELAAGADDLFQETVVTDSLKEALLGCHVVFATSVRSRDLALPTLTPALAASTVAEAGDQTEVAFVFGREHAGLTNEELLHAHYQVVIPSDPAWSSLNLAQSVQIIAYELRLRLLAFCPAKPEPQEALATAESVEQFYEQLEQVLIDIDFLKPSNPKKLLLRLRRLFNRTRLEWTEVNILRGILTQIRKGRSL